MKTISWDEMLKLSEKIVGGDFHCRRGLLKFRGQVVAFGLTDKRMAIVIEQMLVKTVWKNTSWKGAYASLLPLLSSLSRRPPPSACESY